MRPLAPFQADRFSLWGESGEAPEAIGQQFEIVGYGNTGDGANGEQPLTSGTKRTAQNEVGRIEPNGRQLTADFDGQGIDTLGDGPGLGANEGGLGLGDTGGSSILTSNVIVGIASFSSDVDGNGNFSNFGDTFTVTRVSAFIPYISAIRDAAGPLVVDMNFQEEGNNGNADNVLFRRNGADIELLVNSVPRHSVPFARVTNIEFIGSPDTDILTIDESDGPVIPIGGFRFVGGEDPNAEDPNDNDTLIYVGDGTQRIDYLPDRDDDGSGTITVDSLVTITFSELEPVTVSNVASLVVTTPNSQDIITLDSPAANQNRISGTSGGTGFEAITFFNIPTVTLELGANDDAVNLPNADDMFTMTAPGLVADGLTIFTINGGVGNDTFSVIGSATTRININGDAPVAGDQRVPPGDRLAVDATSFAGVVFPNNPNGVVTAAGMAPITFTSIESIVPSDRFENNNTIATATVLGSETEVTLRDLSIHNATDVDFFRVTAHETGKLYVRTMFSHALGNLVLEIVDRSEKILGRSNTTTDDEIIIIPVVQGEDYFVRVFGFAGAVNEYALEIEQFPAPIPSRVFLDPSFGDETVRLGSLSVSFPTLFISADVLNFADSNLNGVATDPRIIRILRSDQITPAPHEGTPAGVAVQVFHNGAHIGFADPIDNGTLFRFTPMLPLASIPINDGGLNQFTAAVRVFDGTSSAPFSGRSPLSPPLNVITDDGPKLGVWSGGSVYIDLNGDKQFSNPNNLDVVHTLGLPTDHIFNGDFRSGIDEEPGTPDDGTMNRFGAFDRLAAYGRVGGRYRWLIDFNNDGVPDQIFNEPANFDGRGIPVAGNFNLNGADGDEIGLFTGTHWILDTQRTFTLADETPILSEIRGLPVVGDFNGDGIVDLATYDPVSNTFFVSISPATGPDAKLTFSFRIGHGAAFIGTRERPVAADMNGDGVDDLGLWVPDRSGLHPERLAEWYFIVSDAGRPLIEERGLQNRIVPDLTTGEAVIRRAAVRNLPELLFEKLVNYRRMPFVKGVAE